MVNKCIVPVFAKLFPFPFEPWRLSLTSMYCQFLEPMLSSVFNGLNRWVMSSPIITPWWCNSFTMAPWSNYRGILMLPWAYLLHNFSASAVSKMMASTITSLCSRLRPLPAQQTFLTPFKPYSPNMRLCSKLLGTYPHLATLTTTFTYCLMRAWLMSDRTCTLTIISTRLKARWMQCYNKV